MLPMMTVGINFGSTDLPHHRNPAALTGCLPFAELLPSSVDCRNVSEEGHQGSE
jgi:hypothetical protein